jgi:hypothetical protein
MVTENLALGQQAAAYIRYKLTAKGGRVWVKVRELAGITGMLFRYPVKIRSR